MPDTDEATEHILEIVSKETNWKHACDSEPVVLNIEGVMRVRIRDILDNIVEGAEHDGMEHADENREPAFDWSDLD